MKTSHYLAPLLLTGIASAQFGTQGTLISLSNPYDIDQVDLDLDGDMDLVVASFSPGTVYTLENLGNGTLGQPQPVSAVGGLGGCNRVKVADINGDGDPDILAIAFTASKIVWYPSIGSGLFGMEQPISTTVISPTAVLVEDIDGDGALDVISASLSTDTLYFHRNLGIGMFAPQVPLSSAVDGPTGLAYADLNNDGFKDLISSSSNDNKIAWYAGTMAGTFGSQQLITSEPNGAQDVLAVDLDNDGFRDVAYCSSTDARVRWSKNLGGTFAPPQTLSMQCSGATRLSAEDYDQDGDIDLAAACTTTSRIEVYENLGSGSFAAPTPLLGLKRLVRLCEFVDLDGDLDLDVVGGGNATSTGALVLNRNIQNIGTTYCTSPANSSGAPGVLTVTGSKLANRDLVALTASDLSVNSCGYFITSRMQGMVNQPAGSVGVLCLSGSIGRYVGQGQILFTGGSRSMSLVLDTDQVPQPLGFVSFLPGDTWNFQAWHRDTVNGQPSSNFSDAATLTFQ